MCWSFENRRSSSDATAGLRVNESIRLECGADCAKNGKREGGSVTRQPYTWWHQVHGDKRTRGQRLADSTARVLGSWSFIIAQTILVFVWIVLNVAAIIRRWDPYPFILLNLMFSLQAAYAAPIIMMSQNRQAERDRFQAQSDFDTNVKAECEIEDIQAQLIRIERTLEEIKTRPTSAAH